MNYKTSFNKKLVSASLLAITLSFTGCKDENVQKLPERNYNLVWSDEFDGAANTSPDATKWTFDIGRGDNGWGNEELQTYTNSTNNVAHDGEGNLVITAIRTGDNFTSGRIKTQGLYAKAYGRFEARLKTPYGPGLWPAFWLLGENIETVTWPQCGELDIMELRGQEPNIIHGSIHGPGYSAGNAITKGYALPNGRFDTEYHVFAMEWTEDRIDFFVDDFLYHRIEKANVPGEWVYNQPFFMLFNVAVGGTYVGFPTAQTPFPQKMIIDYVRVYDIVQ